MQTAAASGGSLFGNRETVQKMLSPDCLSHPSTSAHVVRRVAAGACRPVACRRVQFYPEIRQTSLVVGMSATVAYASGASRFVCAGIKVV